MICKYCNKEMKKDDVYFLFNGYQNNYWLCGCGAYCIEKIRYSKLISIDWCQE